MTYEDVVQKLIAAREAQHISQRKMAQRLGMTPQALSMIEGGLRHTGPETLAHYAAEVGLRYDMVLSPATGMVSMEVPAENLELIEAASRLPPEMAAEMIMVMKALPSAPPAFRAGVMAALRSLLPAVLAA